MAADLASRTMFQRISLVVLDDCLVKLEHGRTEDRVRRFMFDSIESLVIWRKVPWIRVTVCTLLFVAPGILLMFVPEPGPYFGAFFLLLGLALDGWYFYCRRTTIRLMRDGVPHDLEGIFRPGKVRKLTTRLIAGINAVQAPLRTAALTGANPDELAGPPPFAQIASPAVTELIQPPPLPDQAP